MTRLCTNVWTTTGNAVYNTGLSTYQQTTWMQDVFGSQPVLTAKRHMLFGSNRVNPQFTSLITVIRFIYRFAHAITDRAHISNNRLAR